MKQPVDFHHLPTRHDQINLRLEEWARWVRVSGIGWMTQPMFRMALSNSRQWHQPKLREPINTLNAHEIERAVCALPHAHRLAIRWYYVFSHIHPGATARKVGTSIATLRTMIDEARDMLMKRLETKIHDTS